MQANGEWMCGILSFRDSKDLTDLNETMHTWEWDIYAGGYQTTTITKHSTLTSNRIRDGLFGSQI